MTTKTDRLIQLFGKQIAHGVFAPGAALPSEADLCARFGASRNVMREVIKVLATKRLIAVKSYSRLFTMPREQWNYLDVDVLGWVLQKGKNSELIHSLLDIRTLIEPMMARWAATRATAADLMELEECLDVMSEHLSNPQIFHHADIRFHKAILVATHNLVVQQMGDAIGVLQRAIFEYTYSKNVKRIDMSTALHQELFDAIRRKNPAAAEKISRKMVLMTEQRAIDSLFSSVA